MLIKRGLLVEVVDEDGNDVLGLISQTRGDDITVTDGEYEYEVHRSGCTPYGRMRRRRSFCTNNKRFVEWWVVPAEGRKFLVQALTGTSEDHLALNDSVRTREFALPAIRTVWSRRREKNGA